MKLNESKIRRRKLERQIFLAAGNAWKAILWPTPGFRWEPLIALGSLEGGTSVSASAVPQYEGPAIRTNVATTPKNAQQLLVMFQSFYGVATDVVGIASGRTKTSTSKASPDNNGPWEEAEHLHVSVYVCCVASLWLVWALF